MTHFKINENYKRSAETQAYIDMMVKERPRVTKIPPSTEQPASTKRILAMTKEEHDEHMNRPWPPEGWEAEHTDIAMAKTLQRVGPEQYSHALSVKASSKNTLGQSEKDGSGEERKELARQAFTCSPPTGLTETQKEFLTRMDPITMLEKVPLEQPGIFNRFFEWLFRKELKDTRRMIDLFDKKEEWEKTIKEKK